MGRLTQSLAPAGLAAFAITYLWQAAAIPLDPWSAADAINARTLPVVYGVLLLILSLGLLIRAAWTQEAPAARDPRGAWRRWRVLAMHCGAIAAFGVLIPFAGLWVALAALLAASLIIAGERRPLVLVLAPLATPALAWLLLVVLLDVYIDPGRWFS